MLNEFTDYKQKTLKQDGDQTTKVKKVEVPIWCKYTLTVEEAAEYFRIGQKRLRAIIAEDPNAEFILMNGNRAQIKRKLFEAYVDSASAI
ncbi:MAG: excisionase [Blautia sp.]|nr:excisionase [Blautia sp.]